MKLFWSSLSLALVLTASGFAKAESPVVYGVGAAKVVRSTSDFFDGQYNVTYAIVEVDDPKVEHTLLFRLDPKLPAPPMVQRLNELAASLDGFELDITLRCKKPVSTPSRPFYDMVKMGCEVLSVGHRRPL